MLKSYVKILALAGRYLDVVIDGSPVIEITEKIDGSQFVFGKDEEGKLHFRSKGAVINSDAPPALFAPAVAHVLSIQHLISNDTAFYAETLQKPRHNSLQYDRIPRNHIALYGMTDFNRTMAFPHWNTLMHHADVFEVETVPILYKGPIESASHIKSFLEGDSALGGGLREGVVLKRYDYPTEYNGQVYPFAAFKWVSEKFKEVHASNPDWKRAKDSKGELYEEYRTKQRWMKAVQFLRDNDELVGQPKDIGKLIPQILKDVEEEEAANFKERLYNIYRKEWLGHCIKGFPEWYKEYLIEEGLNEA